MTPPGERDRRLENYDRTVAESRARIKAANERHRTWDLERLERERLSPAEREKRMSELRMKWWHEDFNADLDARIRREALVRRLDEIDETAARSRRADEARTIAHTERMVQIYRRSSRGGMPVSIARMFHRIHTERPGDPEILDLREQVDRWARELDIDIRWTAKPVNGYAWQRTKEIEIAPISSEAAFATAAHEIGHVACPCEPDHVRVPRKTWLGTVCVACELAAWRWAITHSPRWSEAMHADMADALPSYRDYGSEAQQAEIDRLTSRLGFHEDPLTARYAEGMKQMEYATTDDRRAPLSSEMRQALEQLKAGARCEVCHGRAVLVRAGRLLCALDGNIARQRAQADRMRAARASRCQASAHSTHGCSSRI